MSFWPCTQNVTCGDICIAAISSPQKRREINNLSFTSYRKLPPHFTSRFVPEAPSHAQWRRARIHRARPHANMTHRQIGQMPTRVYQLLPASRIKSSIRDTNQDTQMNLDKCMAVYTPGLAGLVATQGDSQTRPWWPQHKLSSCALW